MERDWNFHSPVLRNDEHLYNYWTSSTVIFLSTVEYNRGVLYRPVIYNGNSLYG